MGRAVLQGICTALLVTVLTLIAGIIWTSSGIGIVSISRIVDIGLLASCLMGGFRTGRQTNLWFTGTLVGIGYVIIGSMLLALFTPLRGTGFLQVLLTGALLGSVAGAFGTRTTYQKAKRSFVTKKPYYRNSPYADCPDDADRRINYGVGPMIKEQEDKLFSEELLFFEDQTGDKKPGGGRMSPWWEEECTTHNG
ncbi:MAG: TIGR04086 family membrane protein [Desulfitobacteriaceae bacterium]|nr:TIGR04086 family membrane protein [Desulfitobacteriaceae bacterium]MDD4345725.1 TIGR04086 family membrane protein [Desulfitobacteriaceae bacterium]MDD4400417.1 TIGR04086 family membrane protein [Desulfitobacteriaceae bacterium]